MKSGTLRLVNMIITNDLVEAFLKCPTKCFLRSCGKVGTGNAYATWVRTKNNVFRIEGTKRLVAGVAPDRCVIGTPAMGSLKSSQWHLGIDFAVQSQNLRCSCHAVEQIPSAAEAEPRSLSRFDSCRATSSTGTTSFYWHLMASGIVHAAVASW